MGNSGELWGITLLAAVPTAKPWALGYARSGFVKEREPSDGNAIFTECYE
jgi:hypothetical protein